MVNFDKKTRIQNFLLISLTCWVCFGNPLQAQTSPMTALEKERAWEDDKSYPKGTVQRAIEYAVVDGKEETQAKEEEDKPKISVGGALRFNYHYDSWRDNGHKEAGGELIYDVFRINAKAAWKGVFLNAEYRLYSQEFGGGYLKQGWIGYHFNDNNTIHLGLTQVPFGIQQYNSSNWFFNIGYYVGLEDDHDIGVKYMHHKDRGLNWQLAFFKNAEYAGFANGESSFSRYSYDITSFANGSEGSFRNREANTLSGKLEYIFGETATHKIGVSGQFGQLWNFDTQEMGDRMAVSAHYHAMFGNFDFKAQYAYYNINPANPDNETADFIAMSAYGFPYYVASEASIITAGLSYSLDVDWGPVSNLTFYNDFGLLSKAAEDFEDTYQNVTGVLVTAGQLYTYIDMAQGKNQPWMGGDYNNGLAVGLPGSEEANWEFRFNINFGYYF